MPRAIVTASAYRWMDPDDLEAPGRTAFLGEEIDVTDAELKRGIDLDALEKAGAKPAVKKDTTEGQES